MSLAEKIEYDLKEALKSGDGLKVSTLRFLVSAIKYKEIETKSNLNDAEVCQVIGKQVKTHQESIEAFKKGQRPDLVEKEEAELKILESFLPSQLSADQIREAVNRLIDQIKEKGETPRFAFVIKEIMASLKGRASGDLVKGIVEEVLKEG